MNSSFQTLDLSRMYSNLVFESRSAADFQAHLRQALNNHVMSWGPGEVDSALYSIDTRHLRLMILRYGPAVEIRPDPFDGFILVQVPLRGRSVIKSDGEITSIGPGQVAVLAPRRENEFSLERKLRAAHSASAVRLCQNGCLTALYTAY